MHRTMTALAFAIGLPAWTAAVAQEEGGVGTAVEEAGAEIALEDWNYEDVYAEGWSAERFIDEAEVYGAEEEQIGDVENIVVGKDGQILAVIIEVGGFLDIGDTHLAVGWDDVTVESLDRITVPITEQNAEEFATAEEYGYGVEEDIGGDLAEQEMAAAGDAELEPAEPVDPADIGADPVDVAEGGVGETPVEAMAVPEDLEESELVEPQQFLVSEALDDLVFLEGAREVEEGLGEEEEVAEYAAAAGYGTAYGYIEDLVFNEDGKLTAVIVEPSYGYGPGPYAYPWYGWGYGYPYGYYGLPYGEEEITGVQEFDEAALGGYEEEDTVE